MMRDPETVATISNHPQIILFLELGQKRKIEGAKAGARFFSIQIPSIT